MTALVLALDSKEACDPNVTGAKAARLAQLSRAGLPVPQGFALAVQAFERALASRPGATEADLERLALEPALLAQVRAALLPFGDAALAVRSSAVDEDLDGASFAGQYESVLDVRGLDGVARAILRCWASALAPRVRQYLEARGIASAPRMGVLVQRLIAPRASGVAFTADPLTGRRDAVVVNAVRGIGERLVSGQANADVWYVRNAEAESRHVAEGSITRADAVAIGAMARRVEELYGSAQDIEWALDAADLYLLQARPVTALPTAVEWKSPQPGLWLRMFRIGEWLTDPVTPLFETWLLERMEQRLFAGFKAIAATDPGPHHVIVHRWYFSSGNFMPSTPWRALWLGARYLLPGIILRPAAMTLLTTRWAQHGMSHFERAWRSGPAQKYADAVAQVQSRLDRADRDILVSSVAELSDLAGDELFYFFAVGGSAWKVELAFARFHAHYIAPRLGGSHQVLLAGLGSNDAVSEHAVYSLDWFHPTAGELGMAGAEGGRARRAAARAAREAQTHSARAALPTRRLRDRFDTLLERAQHFGRVREEQAARLSLAWPILRRCIARLAEPLLRGGQLRHGDDAYFLTRDELLEPPAHVAELVIQRREDWTRARRLTPPAHLGELRGIRARILIGTARSLGASDDSAQGLTGTPASPGRAEGRVRIIRSPLDFDRLQTGEVLVAAATSPAWTPLFARAAAVVTDTGSAMAHASLVAREYAIPAVVGTNDATTRLHDGQWVLVDGNLGKVQLQVQLGVQTHADLAS
jgi:phosphohistidine swiveling domain-containing protein